MNPANSDDYTLRAREVLEDCREALQRLGRLPREAQSWRIDWVAAVALLRAVGHVLREEDRKGPAREAIDERWEQWRAQKAEYPIFWEFIDRERNSVLKAYRFGVGWKSATLTDNAGNVLTDSAGNILTAAGNALTRKGGIFESYDALGLYEAALAWWDDELRLLESQIGS